MPCKLSPLVLAAVLKETYDFGQSCAMSGPNMGCEAIGRAASAKCTGAHKFYT